jgi:hypothetical protein
MRQLRHFLAGGIVALTLLLALPSAAFATFMSSTAEHSSFASATLAAPTKLSVTKNCSALTATLTWTATSSAYATGYTLQERINSNGTGTISTGNTQTSYTISITRSNSYQFDVAASYLSWTSAPTSWSTSLRC